MPESQHGASHLSSQPPRVRERATKKVQRQPRLYSEFHVRLGYRVRLYLQKKKEKKNDAKTNLSDILQPVHPSLDCAGYK